MAYPQNEPPYTLITGASSGLGKALAFECAKRNRNLLLVALPEDGLHDVKAGIISKYSIDVRILEIDLNLEVALKTLFQLLPRSGINCLINNVGIGGTMIFKDTPISYLNEMINLNVRTTALLTHNLLPELIKHKSARIINISSLISQYPSPFKTIYPASKAFVYFFSKGLRFELRNTQIGVSVVLPGPMQTNPEIHDRINRQGAFAKVALLSTPKTAKIIMNGSDKNRSVIIPGRINKLYWALMKIIPYRIGLPILYSVYRKEMLATPRESIPQHLDLARYAN